MSVHAYPMSATFADYLRSAAGLLFGLVPLATIKTTPVVFAFLVFISVVFSTYAVCTLYRQFTRIEIDEHGIKVRGPRRAKLPWEDIRDLRLSYFSTRFDKSGGWLHLRLSGNGQSLKVDSRIDGFDFLAARAAAAATCNGARLDFATRQNFQALGIAGYADPLEGAS